VCESDQDQKQRTEKIRTKESSSRGEDRIQRIAFVGLTHEHSYAAPSTNLFLYSPPVSHRADIYDQVPDTILPPNDEPNSPSLSLVPDQSCQITMAEDDVSHVSVSYLPGAYLRLEASHCAITATLSESTLVGQYEKLLILVMISCSMRSPLSLAITSRCRPSSRS
jgi:hypothetical protein